MPKPRSAVSYSLATDAKDLLDRLAEHLDLPKNRVLDRAVRQLARKELPRETAPEKTSKNPSNHS